MWQFQKQRSKTKKHQSMSTNSEFKNPSQKNNLEKLQQKLNEIMDWKKNYDQKPPNSASEQVTQKSGQKSFTYIHQCQANTDGWRSITPDRPASSNVFSLSKSRNFAQASIPVERKEKVIITEPNDCKKVVKSFSQESNLNDITRITKQTQSYYFNPLVHGVDNKPIQKKQNKSQLELNSYLEKVPASTVAAACGPKQQLNAHRLNEIGQQINAILSQTRVSKKLTHPQRPQSEAASMYEQNKKYLNSASQQLTSQISGPNFPSSQNQDSSLVNSSGQLNSVNSTNLQIRKLQGMGFESFIDELKRGTETERGYQQRQQIVRQQISDVFKHQLADDKKLTPHRSINDEKADIFKQSLDDKKLTPHRSMNDDIGKIKRTGFSSEQSSQSKQLYLQYLRMLQKKRLSEKSPLVVEEKQSQKWSSEKKDLSTGPRRQASYYTQNQSHSQTSVRRQDERYTDNPKSENTTSRPVQSNSRVLVSNYVNEKTPTKNLFGTSVKNVQSPRMTSNINSLLSSLGKINNRSSAPSSEKQNQYLGHFSQKNQALATHIIEDPNSTHIIVGFSDFSLKVYNIQSKRGNIVIRHTKPIVSLSNIIETKQMKLFASGQRDGVIRIFYSESGASTYYRLLHQFRVESSPLIILMNISLLYVITANQVIIFHEYQKRIPGEIKLHGTIKDAKVNHFNELLIGINNKIYKVRRNELVLQFEHIHNELKEFIYYDEKLYTLWLNNQVICFDEGVKLKRNNTQINQDFINQLFHIKKDQITYFNGQFGSSGKKAYKS